MLKAGDIAPSFSLADDGGRKVDSAKLKGKRHVIYFYPKDDTPGCTREACAFRDNLPAFEKLSVPVFGVSGDETRAHERFARKYSLNFPLLADPEHKLLEPYGVWVEKSMYGRKYFGIQRSTFVIDAKGRIERVWEKVSPDKHAEEVLAYLTGAAAPENRSPITPVARKAVAKKAAETKTAATKPAAKKSAAKKPAAKKPAVKKSPKAR